MKSRKLDFALLCGLVGLVAAATLTGCGGDDDGGDGDDDDDDDFDADADDEFESDDDEDDSGWVFAHGDEIAALAPNHFSKTVVLYEIVGHDTAFVVVVGAALRAED